LIDHYVPNRYYDYSIYFPNEVKAEGAEQERLSVLAGVILGANRQKINHILEELKEDQIVQK
jgi:hypothetical protein